jgi:hypothetical protein
MNLTILFIIFLVIIIFVFDVWIMIKEGKYESISAHILRGSKKIPLVTFLCGMVAGHLLWSMDSFDYLEPQEIAKKCEKFYNIESKDKQ